MMGDLACDMEPTVAALELNVIIVQVGRRTVLAAGAWCRRCGDTIESANMKRAWSNCLCVFGGDHAETDRNDGQHYFV